MSRAFAVSRRAGYVSFCRNETGRLLAALAATRGRHPRRVRHRLRRRHRLAAVGRARRAPSIVTAELDAKLAKAAAEIFADDPQVEVLAADWSTLVDKGPFSLLFLDSGEPDGGRRRQGLADLVEQGGIVVLDDFTPCETGRRSTPAASTPCASSGSATTGSPPSR